MAKLLLLYDTKQTDLAHDFERFLRELNLEVVMIQRSPDRGKTLQEKEKHYFSNVDGAVFLITPGSDRDGKHYPSASVADEMGQAKVYYSTAPEKVSYLVDKQCTIQAVDQSSYIYFDREDIRSIIDAVTQLVRNLKCAGFLGDKKSERQETPRINVPEFAKTIEPRLKAICEALSDAPNGAMKFTDFEMMLNTKFSLKSRLLNFAKIDLKTKGLVIYHPPAAPHFVPVCQLSQLGIDIVRHEMKLRAQAQFERIVKSQPGKGLLEMAYETRGEKAYVEDLSALEAKPPALGKNASKRGLLDLGPKPPALGKNALTGGLLDLEPPVPAAIRKNALAKGLLDLEPPVPAAIRKNALAEGLAALDPKPRAVDPAVIDLLKKK